MGEKIAIKPRPTLDINISNPANIKQLFDNMQNDLALIISYVDVGVKECAEQNMQLASTQEDIASLTANAKKFNNESINLESQLREHQSKISMIEHDVLKFKNALDGVMDLTADLPVIDNDKIKNILTNSFMNETLKLERAVASLKLFHKTKDIKDDKRVNIQNSLSKLETNFHMQSAKVSAYTLQVEKSINQVCQTYFDVMVKSNDIMQMTIGIPPNDDLNNVSNHDYYKQEEEISKNNSTPIKLN